jgi:hypothetical protein
MIINKKEHRMDLKITKTIFLPFFRLYYSHEWEQLKVDTQLTFFIKMQPYAFVVHRYNPE